MLTTTKSTQVFARQVKPIFNYYSEIKIKCLVHKQHVLL